MAFDRKAYMKRYKKLHPEKFKKPEKPTKKPKNKVETEIKQETPPQETPIVEKTEIAEETTQETPPQAEPIVEETPAAEEKPQETRPTEEKPKTDEGGNGDAEDFFSQMRGEYKAKEEEAPKVNIPQAPATPQPTPEENKLLISGYMFLLAVNVIYPDLLLWILSYMSKKYRTIKAEKIALDDTQMEMIEEIADEFVKVYLPKMSPMAIFLICLNGMYFQNIKKVLKEESKIEIL
jgi:hypothetical protein